MTEEIQVELIEREPSGSDELGTPQYVESAVTIFAEVIGTKRNEFYQGLAAGLKPEITLNIWKFEYSGQKIIRIGDKRYQITHTYPVGDERLEVVCADIAKGG